MLEFMCWNIQQDKSSLLERNKGRDVKGRDLLLTECRHWVLATLALKMYGFSAFIRQRWTGDKIHEKGTEVECEVLAWNCSETIKDIIMYFDQIYGVTFGLWTLAASINRGGHGIWQPVMP